MSNPNPFASPQAAPGIGGGPGMEGGLSPNAATILSKTRGWVMLYAILMYIVAAILLIGLAAAGNVLREIPQFAGLGSLFMVGILVTLAYVLVEAVLLTLFANKIGGYLQTGSSDAMAAGLKNIRVFWILEGVRQLLMIVFGVIGLLSLFAR
jgi:hypothetical protein